MLNRSIHIGVWVMFVITVMMIVVNALFMLISPAWLRLPGWLRLGGELALQRCGGGRGLLKVCILGAIFIATVIWIAAELLTHTAKP